MRSPAARSLLLLAEEVQTLLGADTGGVLRVVHAGVRLFEKEEAKGCDGCGYRVCQDGLPLITPFQQRQRVPCTVGEATRLLQCSGNMLSAATLEAEHPTLAAALRTGCRPGSVVLTCNALADGLPLSVVALYTPSGALGPMVKGQEKQALLFRLGA